MSIRTLLWTRNICRSGTKSSKTDHQLCCNTTLLWLQDLRLLEWPPGMQSRGEEIRASYSRKCDLPSSGSHSESHPKRRTSPGFCHHIVAGRLAAHKNIHSGKFCSFSQIFIQYLKSRIAMILSSTSCFCKIKWLSDHIFRSTLMMYAFLWWFAVPPYKAYLHRFWQDFCPTKGETWFIFPC